MTFNFYDSNEDIEKEESINKYRELFIEYVNNPPNLKDSLIHLFNSSGITGNKADKLYKDIIEKKKKK